MDETGEYRNYTAKEFKSMQRALQYRKGNAKFNLVVVPFETINVQDSQDQERLEVAKDLIRRMQANQNIHEKQLLNPLDSKNDKHPRALSLNELTSIEDIEFSEDDTLYICGHGNQAIIGSMSPIELANNLAPFIERTGLKNIKLAGCHTGDRLMPDEIIQKVANLRLLHNLSKR